MADWKFPFRITCLCGLGNLFFNKYNLVLLWNSKIKKNWTSTWCGDGVVSLLVFLSQLREDGWGGTAEVSWSLCNYGRCLDRDIEHGKRCGFWWFLEPEGRRTELELFLNILCPTLLFTLLWPKMGFRKRAKKRRVEEERCREMRTGRSLAACSCSKEETIAGITRQAKHWFLFSRTPPLPHHQSTGSTPREDWQNKAGH